MDTDTTVRHADAIRNVSVVSTGMASLHPEHMYGTKKPALWWVARSKEWITVPLNLFVIEHADRLVLFDTGIDPGAVADPAKWMDRITRWFSDRVFRFEIGPEDTLGNALAAAGYSAHDVQCAVLSHMHFDHVGGVDDIPHAALFVAPESWELLAQSAHPERDFVPRRMLLVPGRKWKLLEFEPTTDPAIAPFTEVCDVLRDGSLMVVRTPGHLPGSVSMLIRRSDAPPILLVGDLTYAEELLIRDQPAGRGDKDQLLDSFAKVRALKDHTPDLVIVAGHDTTATEKLERARSTAMATT